MQNKKSFLTVFIIFLILIGIYYSIWSSQVKKVEKTLGKDLQNLKYSSIEISGFPFKKQVYVKNLEFNFNKNFMTNNILKVKDIKLLSTIFSNTYKILLTEVEYIDSSNEEEIVSKLTFNDVPKISCSFYKNGKIKALTYSDIGYRVMDKENKTVYTADSSSLNLNSVKTETGIDYQLDSSFDGIQNMQILNTAEKKDVLEYVPDLYSLRMNILKSYVTTSDDLESADKVITINDITWKNKTQKTAINLTGILNVTQDDSLPFGQVTLKISEFNKIKDNFLEKVHNTTITDESGTEKLVKDDKETSIIFDQLATILTRLGDKNVESTETDKIFLLQRDKKEFALRVNGENLSQAFEELENDKNVKAK